MKTSLRDLPAFESEPLSRTELWIAAVAIYLILGTFLFGHFGGWTSTAEQERIIPLTHRA
jgi:hypothetical protein